MIGTPFSSKRSAKYAFVASDNPGKYLKSFLKTTDNCIQIAAGKTTVSGEGPPLDQFDANLLQRGRHHDGQKNAMLTKPSFLASWCAVSQRIISGQLQGVLFA